LSKKRFIDRSRKDATKNKSNLNFAQTSSNLVQINLDFAQTNLDFAQIVSNIIKITFEKK